MKTQITTTVTADDIKDMALKSTDKLVDLGFVKDCMDADEGDEFTVQDAIREVLFDHFKIKDHE